MPPVLIRNQEDLTPLEKLSLINMSYSRLDTYDMCNAKYFYTYVTKDERVFGEHATLGNIVHSVLEGADFVNLSADVLQAQFLEQRDIWDPEEKISQDLIEVGKQIIEEFVGRHEGDAFHDVGREFPFEIVIGSALFRGFIDRVDFLPDNSIVLIDYKTGKYQATQKWAHQNLQLGLYAIVMHHMFPDRGPIRGELYYLRTGKVIHHTYTDEDFEWLTNAILNRVQEIISSNNFAYTKNTRICSFCDFAKTNVCKRGASLFRR